MSAGFIENDIDLPSTIEKNGLELVCEEWNSSSEKSMIPAPANEQQENTLLGPRVMTMDLK